MDTIDVYKNVYEMNPILQQTFFNILYAKLKGPWQLKFVCKMYAKVFWNVGTFCIHFV